MSCRRLHPLEKGFKIATAAYDLRRTVGAYQCRRIVRIHEERGMARRDSRYPQESPARVCLEQVEQGVLACRSLSEGVLDLVCLVVAINRRPLTRFWVELDSAPFDLYHQEAAALIKNDEVGFAFGGDKIRFMLDPMHGIDDKKSVRQSISTGAIEAGFPIRANLLQLDLG